MGIIKRNGRLPGRKTAVLLLGLLILMYAYAGVTLADAGIHGGYGALTDACASCHRTHTATSPRLLIQPDVNLCLSCHGSTGAGADTNVADGFYMERDGIAEDPVEGVTNRGLKGGGFNYTLMDTDGDEVVVSNAVTSSHDGNMAIAWGNGAIGSGFGKEIALSCSSCHDPHGGGNYRSLRQIPYDSGAPGPVTVTDEIIKDYTIESSTGNYFSEYYDTRASELSGWCSQCHTRYHAPAGSGHTSSGDPIFAYRHPTDFVPCVKCHVAHGTSASMSTVAGVQVEYPDGSRAASDNARSSLLRLDDREVCFACHVSSTGQVTEAVCTVCHSQPQGSRRQIVGTGADFELTSHHVNGVVTDSDCTACHNVSTHQSGVVKLLNVDTRETINFDGPVTDLEPFCLACHDGDGAGGSAPFNDGIMPPIVDQTAWDAAAHSGASTCYDCHDNGHGSTKSSLLAPWNALPDASPADPLRQEERFCYQCHDGGIAATDIESVFNQTSHHNVSTADAGGEYVECTNCHNPHINNSTNLTANPDDTSQLWTGSDTNFCLTCHDGTQPVGVSFPASAAGTGYDKSAYINSTHDNQLTNYGCRHCHDQHGSTFNSLLLQQYVTTDFNTYNVSDYQLCFTCHDNNQVMSADNAFEDLHDKHVDKEDAPCIHCHDAHLSYNAGEVGLIDFTYGVNHMDIDLMGNDLSNAYTPGSCSLNCHGENHSPETYTGNPIDTILNNCTACHPGGPP